MLLRKKKNKIFFSTQQLFFLLYLSFFFSQILCSLWKRVGKNEKSFCLCQKIYGLTNRMEINLWQIHSMPSLRFYSTNILCRIESSVVRTDNFLPKGRLVEKSSPGKTRSVLVRKKLIFSLSPHSFAKWCNYNCHWFIIIIS